MDDGLHIVYSDHDDEAEREEYDQRVAADERLMTKQETQNHLKALNEGRSRKTSLTEDYGARQITLEEDLHHVLHQLSFSQSTKM